MIPPPTFLDPAHPDFPARVAEVPNVSGVYLLTPETGIPYLGWSGYLSKRLKRLLLGTDRNSNLFANLRSRLAKLEYWLTGSRLETSLLLYSLARENDPERYRLRLKLKNPLFLTLLLSAPFPRLTVRNRLSSRQALTYGPFPNRESVERFQQG